MNLPIIISVTAFAALLSIFVAKKARLLETINVVAAAVELALCCSVLFRVVYRGSYFFSSYLFADDLAALFLVIIAVVGFAASIYSVGYIRSEMAKGILGMNRVRQYYVLLRLFLMAMYLAVLSNNPIIMWMAIEATTLSTAFLVSFYNKPSAMEAAWKYLIINSIGLLLGFWGTLLFISGATTGGVHGLVSWDMLVVQSAAYNPSLLKVAFVFVLVGYGTKMGLAPMHTWLPDAHSKAPIPISSLLSAVLLNIALFAILRFKIIADHNMGSEFSQTLLVAFGILSVIISAFIIFAQKNYKRLLAYSSIEHMGIIAIGFGFGGVGAFGALLQIVYHALAKSVLFLSSGGIFLRYSSTKIKNIRGMLKALPVTTALFSIGALAITGVPPFGIFISEFTILAAGIKQYPVVTVILSFSLVIVFAGFLKHATDMFFEEPPVEISRKGENCWMVIPVVLLTVVLVIFGFYLPEPVRLLLTSIASKY